MRIGTTVAAVGTAVFLATASAAALAAATFPASVQAQQPKMAKPNMAKPNLSTSQILSIQKALIAKGYKIKADGTWGKQTESALMKFQKANGITPTGYPDAKTLQALGISG